MGIVHAQDLKIPVSNTLSKTKTNSMIKRDELLVMRAIALCFKPNLKPEEALIYCNLGRTQFAKNCEEFGIFKNNRGYYKREELNKMLSGEASPFIEAASKLPVGIVSEITFLSKGIHIFQ